MATKGHGTPAGYAAGCKSRGGCPSTELPCVDANIRYRSDNGFRKSIDAGIPLEIILEQDGPTPVPAPAKPIRSARARQAIRAEQLEGSLAVAAIVDAPLAESARQAAAARPGSAAPKPGPRTQARSASFAVRPEDLEALEEPGLTREQRTELVEQLLTDADRDVPIRAGIAGPVIGSVVELEVAPDGFAITGRITDPAITARIREDTATAYSVDEADAEISTGDVVLECSPDEVLQPLELDVDDPFNGQHLLGCPEGEDCSCPPVAGLVEALARTRHDLSHILTPVAYTALQEAGVALEDLTRRLLLRERAYSQLLAQNGRLLKRLERRP